MRRCRHSGMFKSEGTGRRSEKALGQTDCWSRALSLTTVLTRSGLDGRGRDPGWLCGVTIGGCGDAETEGGLWTSDEAEIGSGSQLDGGERSWRRVGMSNLRLGQCLAWWSGRLQTMPMCSLLQASLLQSSNYGQLSQIW